MLANFRNPQIRESFRIDAAEQAEKLHRYLKRIAETVEETTNETDTPEARAAQLVEQALEELRQKTDNGDDDESNNDKEFERGYEDGKNGEDYRPSSMAYLNGYQKGQEIKRRREETAHIRKLIYLGFPDASDDC